MDNNFIISHYNDSKNNLLASAKNLLNISKELNTYDISIHIEDTIKQLELDTFKLTIVGEFSRGKSTFINALLGTNILPSKVKPTTAMINRIHYSDTLNFSIVSRNESEPPRTITHDEFKKLCAPNLPDEDDVEDKNRYEHELEYFKQIAMADIGFPNAFCKEGVEIFDTPGTNDIDEAREAITFSFVPNSDAVIFVLSATTPFAASEMMFLQQRILSEHISKVFFVINFKDRLQSVEDEQKIYNYIYSKLQSLMPEPKLYMVSSYDALTIRRLEQGETFKIKSQKYFNLDDTGFTKLENDLSYFLQAEKGKVKLEKAVSRMNFKINALVSDAIALRIAASEMEISDINQKIAELQPKIAHFREDAHRILTDTLNNLAQDEETLIHHFQNSFNELKQRINDDLDNYNGDADEEVMVNYVEDLIRSLQQELNISINNQKTTLMENTLSKTYTRLNKQQEQLNLDIRNSFNINVDLDNIYNNIYESNINETGKLVLGAVGLGIGALFFAPVLGIGAAIGAFFFGKNIKDTYKAYKLDKNITEIKSQVNKALINNKDVLVQNLRSSCQSSKHQIEVKLEKEIANKVAHYISELDQIRLINENEKKSVVEQKEYYQELKEQLLQTKQEALSILDNFTTKEH